MAATGFAASMTAAYRGMRDVMITSGGFCAKGGPYVVANECGDGQTALLLLGVLGLFVFGASLAAALSAVGGPVLGTVLVGGARCSARLAGTSSSSASTRPVRRAPPAAGSSRASCSG